MDLNACLGLTNFEGDVSWHLELDTSETTVSSGATVTVDEEY